MNTHRKGLIWLSAVASLALPALAPAANIGTDTALHSIYDDGWQDLDDGAVTGDAFLPWSLATQLNGGFVGHFIGNSLNLAGGSGADINTGSRSWGMFGSDGGAGTTQADAFRNFNGGALSVGQTFSVDIAVNFRDGYKGIDLRDGATTIFNFNIGGDDYVVNNATTGNGSIGNTFSTNTAFRLAFTQTSIGGGTWSIARSGGVTDLDTGTYTGAASGFKLYVGETTGGSSNDLYVNSLSIVPEPSVSRLLSLVTGACVVLRRRKSAQTR